MTKAARGGGEGPWSPSRVAPCGGKGKAPVDDTTVMQPKRARAARKVTPGVGEASGERSVPQAAEGTPHGLASRGQGGAGGGHASQPPALPAAGAAGKRKSVEMNARDAETSSSGAGVD